MRNWEFEGDLSFKLTFDFGGQVRPEWIAAAVVVFNGVKQAAMIGSMMARIAAQVAGRFATVPIFIMPSELPAPFGNTNGNTTA